MQNQLAKLKPIRPFRKSLQQGELDPHFLTWFQKSWESRSIELGCGAGWHCLQFVKTHPNHALLGIERTQNKFSSFKQRMKNHQFDNLMGLCMDAMDFLPLHLEDESIDQYFILYPNPYPKEKQANKRWHRSSFFEFILQSLKPRGLVHFATNETWYFEECTDYCLRHWGLKLLKRQDVRQGQLPPLTHFEKKYLLSGQTCHRFSFQKS